MNAHTYDMGTLPIYPAALECQKSLKECQEKPTLVEFDWAKIQLARFNLWASDFGVLVESRAPLDDRAFRERDNEYILKNALGLIQRSIGMCLDICALEDGDDVSGPAEHPMQRFSEDLTCAQEDVVQSINQLVRLSEAARSTDLITRFPEADMRFIAADHHELKTVLEQFVRAQSDSTSNAANIDLTPLQQRLIESNLRRRNRFLYSQRRSQRFQMRPQECPVVSDPKVGDKGSKYLKDTKKEISDDSTQPRGDRSDMQGAVSSLGNRQVGEDRKLRFRITRLIRTILFHLRRVLSSRIRTLTAYRRMACSRLPDPVSKYFQDQIQTSTADDCKDTRRMEGRKSVLAENKIDDNIDPSSELSNEGAPILRDGSTRIPRPISRYGYPQPPQVQGGSHSFQCPYCYLTLPRVYLEKKALWRSPDKAPTLFSTIDAFIEHARSQHVEVIPEELLLSEDVSVFATEQHVSFDIQNCPLCNYNGEPNSKELLDHIDRHMQFFALQSLPDSDQGPESGYGARKGQSFATRGALPPKECDYTESSSGGENLLISENLDGDVTDSDENDKLVSVRHWPEDVVQQFVSNLEDEDPERQVDTIRGLARICTQGASDIWITPRFEKLLDTLPDELAWMDKDEIFDSDPTILLRDEPVHTLKTLLRTLVKVWTRALWISFWSCSPSTLYHKSPIGAIVVLICILLGDSKWTVGRCFKFWNPFIPFEKSLKHESLLRTLVRDLFWMLPNLIPGQNHGSQPETSIPSLFPRLNWQRQVKFYGLAHLKKVHNFDPTSSDLPDRISDTLVQRLSDNDQSVRNAAAMAWGEIFAKWKSAGGHNVSSSTVKWNQIL